MRVVFEVIALITLLLAMGVATRIGMLMNFLAAWLLISAVYILVSRIICIVRKKAFVGIWKLYEYCSVENPCF